MNWIKQVRRLFFLIGFCFAAMTAQSQVFSFHCIGEYISGADCPECTGTTSSRLFNGLAIRRSGAYFKNIDCPFIVKVQGSNLIIQEVIYPNPETVTVNLLSTGYANITEFMDSVACPCAMQDTSTTGGGGDPSITNEGILGVAAGGANDALLTSNTSTAVGVTYAGSTTITVTETPAANGGTITFQADTSLIATINDIRNNTFDTVATYADLRLYDKGQKLIYVSGHGIEGFFERIATGPADDDGTVIVGDYSWERVYDRSALNVQWFGAVGDSTTDDGAAIQAAIDEAMARQNTSVYIPAGKYRYTTTLRMYKPIGVSIYGAGMDNTYLFPVNVTGIYVRTDSTELVTDPKYGVLEGRDMMFKDFSMLRVGTNSYSVQAIGIHILGTFNRKMENIRVEEFFATSGTASGKGIGIKIDNPYDPVGFPSLADEATQHNMFENIYVNQCDTGIVFRLLNTVNMHNVKIDESRKVGIVLKNGVVWKGGMVQASVNCGIYIVEDPFPIKGIYIDGVHFEQNSRTNPKYGTIYKGSATTMTNFEAINCRFSQSDSSKVLNLRRVRYANITNNTYAVNLMDTLYFNECNSIILGNDNYYEVTTTSASSNITFLSGNLTVSTEALNGLTLQKDAPGPYALNVGGTAIVDDNLGVGTTGAPAQDLHVQGTARITGSDGTPTALVGRDADGDISAVGLASGLSIISGTLTPADNSSTNEIETFVSTSDPTSHTVTLAPGTTSVQLIEGSNVTLTTGGTAANATVTIAAASAGGTDLSYTGASSPVTLNSSTGTDVTVTAGTGISLAGTATDLTITNTGDLSATNEAWTVDADDADTELITTQTVKFQGGGINVTDYIPGTDILTITGTEVDGSTTNEAWTVDADAGDTEVISNQTLLVAGGGIVSTSYNAAGNTLTVTGTEVDGSITNEGILGVAAGGGNDALLTSNTSTASGVTIAGGGIAAVTESTSANGGTITITATEVDGSTTNEAWTIDGDDAETEVISSQTVKFQGAGINVTDYDAATNVMLITGTEVDGSTSNEIQTITGSGSGTTYALDLSLAGGSIGLIEGTGITIDRTGNDFTFNAASGGTNYQTWRDDGVAATQRPNANFVSNTDIAFTLTDDAGNTETEVTADIPANAVDNAELRQSAALSVIGRSANSTGDVADIAAAADGDVLRRSGTTLGFGDVDLTLGVTGTLPVGNGGTGATNLVNNRVLTGNGTSPIVDEANLTFDGTLLTTTGNQYTTGALSIGTSSTAYKLRVRGAGATSATNSLLIENSTPTSILTIRDDTRITLNQTNSVSASYDGIGSTGSITSTGNSVTGVHNRYTLTSSNDGTVTGNTQYGALYGHTIPALTQSSGAYGIFNTLTNNSTAATGQMTSMFFRTTENENTTTLNNRFGCRGEVLFTGSGDFHNGYGVRGDVTATTTGRWNSGTGFYTAVTNAVTSYGADMVITNNRGTANTQRGIRIQNNVSGSGVVVDNAYGIELRGDASSSGVITTYYGLYQNTIPSGATSYFLYGNQSAARSYLSGTLAVGTNSNASKLFVRGTGATSATMAATFENSGGSDIMNLRDDQRVGIITASPNRTLEVQGEVRITDLVTDTPTKIVGADADGDLDTVGINGYNELHITNGALGTNFHTTISPATLTTVTNNWNPTGLSTAWIIELSGNGSFVLLTGITAPTFNKTLTLYNNGDNSILLPREFSTSSAANRFAFEIVLFPGKQIEIRYSVSEARWLLKSKAGAYEDVQEFYANHLFQSPVSITTADFDFWEITSEAAASLVAPTSGVWSGVSVNTGADAGGLGYVSSKEPFIQTDNSSGTVTWGYCKAVIRTPSSLSDGSNDYAIRVGFNAANGGGGATNGMYFQYNHGLVSGNWGTATTNAGNTQLNNSGVAVTTSTVYVLEMYVQPGLAVSFFINGTRVATNDTFVNTGDDMYISAEIEKSIGTTQRDLQIFTLQGSAALVNQP